MPPKRKPADSSSSPATTTSSPPPPASSNGKAGPKKAAKPPPSDSESSSEEENGLLIDSATKKHINWYWAGDSKKGSQDEWILYAPAVAEKIEKGYQKYKAATVKEKEGVLRKAKVDDDRYVDLKKMFQRRYDDKSKKRAVNRLLEDAKGKGPTTKPVREPTKKKKKADSDEDSDGGSAKKKARLNPKKKKKADSDSEDSADSADDVVSTDPEDSDEDDDDYVKWSWAGDSAGGPSKGGGHQDIWLVYNKKMCKKIEKGFNQMKKRVKVDKERFIDMQNMLQRRYDDESKRRSVKREDPPKKKAKAPTPKASPKVTTIATAKGKKKIANDDESDESEEDDKKKPKAKKTSSTVSSSPSLTTTTTSSSSSAPPPPIAAPPSPPSIASIINSPSNWTKQTSMTYMEVELDKTDDEFVWMQDLFTSTIYGPHKTNPGLSPITFKGLNVTRVVRVQNPVTWMRYHSRKATVLMDAKGKCSPQLSKVLTVHPKGPPVDTNANEFFLFHGLNINSVIGIAKFGFDPRFCSLQGMFGAGLYFAENSSKSNQYCHAGACTNSGAQASSCRCTVADELCLLVCRVTLGDPLVENMFRGNNPGDFWYNKRTEPKKSDNISIYNSVVGESKANYGPAAALMLREYIVYESSQVYPEYKVYYKRMK